MPRVALTVVIDTDAPLGPQVRQARAHGVPWKLLADMTRRCERQLRRAMSEKTDSGAMSGFSDRQTVSICVLNPPAQVHASVPVLGVSSRSQLKTPAGVPLRSTVLVHRPDFSAGDLEKSDVSAVVP